MEKTNIVLEYPAIDYCFWLHPSYLNSPEKHPLKIIFIFVISFFYLEAVVLLVVMVGTDSLVVCLIKPVFTNYTFYSHFFFFTLILGSLNPAISSLFLSTTSTIKHPMKLLNSKVPTYMRTEIKSIISFFSACKTVDNQLMSYVIFHSESKQTSQLYFIKLVIKIFDYLEMLNYCILYVLLWNVL